MKRLLVVTAVVMLSTSAVGCGCRPWGYWWRRATCCNVSAPTACGTFAPSAITYADPYLAPPAIEVMPGPFAN